MTKLWVTSVFAVVSVLGALPGCGSSGGGTGGTGGTTGGAATRCGQVEPCGGSVIGNWKVTTSCFNGASMGSCPNATLDVSGLRVSGNATYSADMTYALMASISGTSVTTIPASCMTSNGVTITCDQLNQSIQMDLATHPDPSVQSYSCVAAGSACKCTEVLTAVNTNETGNYTSAGTQLTTTPNDGSGPSTDDYCVQGTQLHVISVDTSMNMGPMGQATISNDIVLTRQ
jgi:hypothetical protein